MAKTEQPGATPENVARLATTPDALPAGGTALIGIVSGTGGISALVRTATGRIRKVGRGDRLGIWKAVAIDESGLILRGLGRTTRLALPAS